MEMDQGARLWLIKHARTNLWRVPHWYDLDSLIQDGYMTYYRVVQRYIHVKKRSHMMALFKACFTNHVHDLSKQKSRFNETELTEELTVGMIESSCEGISNLIMSAPVPVQGLIRALMTDKGQKKLRKPYLVGKRGRETTNVRWCRIAGVPSRDIDLPALVKTSICSGASK